MAQIDAPQSPSLPIQSSMGRKRDAIRAYHYYNNKDKPWSRQWWQPNYYKKDWNYNSGRKHVKKVTNNNCTGVTTAKESELIDNLKKEEIVIYRTQRAHIYFNLKTGLTLDSPPMGGVYRFATYAEQTKFDVLHAHKHWYG